MSIKENGQHFAFVHVTEREESTQDAIKVIELLPVG